MKKKQLLCLLLVFVYFITMCAFFSSSKKYIRKGDNAMEKGDYKQAIEYYQKAGPDAKDKLIDAWMAKYGSIFTEESGEDERYIRRHEWMQRDLTTAMSEQEITQLLIEKLTEKLDMRNEMVDDPDKDLNIVDANVILADCDEMLLFLQEIPASTPGSSELESYIYETKGNIGYKTLEDTGSNSYYSEEVDENPGWIKLAEEKKYVPYASSITEMLENWSKSSSGKGGQINECINQFKAGNYEAAANKLMELLPNEKINIWILNAIPVETLSEEFDALLQYTAFMRKLNGCQEANSLSNILQGNNSVTFGIMDDDLSTGLTQAHKDQLREQAGTDPQGKILIIHNRNDWEYHVDLYNRLMNNLPDEYYPENLENVEFIIELKYDSEKVGKYTDGSSAFRPEGIVTVYKAPNWNKLFTVAEKGSVKTYVIGNESGSVYPDMSESIEKAIEKILTQIK